MPATTGGLDRAAQHDDAIYSGIESIHLQDQAVTESMGAILDHSFEHLAPSDLMITRTRRRLLMAARALRDNRVPPPGAENVQVFRDARGGYFIATRGAAGRTPMRGNWQPPRVRLRPPCARAK